VTRSENVGRRGGGRLSTQKYPKSSRARIAWLFPAPERPLIKRIRVLATSDLSPLPHYSG